MSALALRLAWHRLSSTLRPIHYEASDLIPCPTPHSAFFVGALTGCISIIAYSVAGKGRDRKFRNLVADRKPWHWLTAIALSAGQTVQFFALKSVSVVIVATLGKLEVLFSALFAVVLTRDRLTRPIRLLVAGLLAGVGTALLFE